MKNVKKYLSQKNKRIHEIPSVLIHFLLLVVIVVFVMMPDIVYAKEAEEYQILTKRYVRRPDGYLVQIEWPKIVGTGNQWAYDNINYILERNVFREVGKRIWHTEEFDHVLQGIADMRDQAMLFFYEIKYQDSGIFCVRIEERNAYYTEDRECFSSGEGSFDLVFDVETGNLLDLSDFIEIDRRIVDFVAEDYQPTEYDSAINGPSYSFMDAFEVYEDEKYEHHEVMNVEEAIEALKSGEIKWLISEDKTLVLYWDDSTFQDEAWVRIPYSYIEEFAYY